MYYIIICVLANIKFNYVLLLLCINSLMWMIQQRSAFFKLNLLSPGIYTEGQGRKTQVQKVE